MEQRGLELCRLEQCRLELGWLELGRLELGWLEQRPLGRLGGMPMKIKTIFRISGMLLLAIAVSAVAVILVYALQNPQVVVSLASIGWNGYLIS
jgi:hypothetical protein